MTKLSKQFDVLVARMKDYELYHVDDDIHHELTTLKEVIDEVEKRLLCVKKTSDEIYKAILKHIDDIDSGASFDMLAVDGELIRRGVVDNLIAVDLDDNEPIVNNWYYLFSIRAFKVTSDIHNSVSNKIFDVLHISLNEKGERMGELNARDPEDNTRNLIVNLDLEGVCLSEGEMQVAMYEEYKHEIKECLYRLFNSMRMDLPTNFDEILDFVISDVEETADRNWSDGDVASGFRRWIESK
jgi:hypothetical protein